MAEEKSKEDTDDIAAGETEELEKMLEDSDAEGMAEAGLIGKTLGLAKKLIPKDKKTMIITGIGALVLLVLLVGGATYFLSNTQVSDETDKDTGLPLETAGDGGESKVKKKEDSFILKTAIFALDPFFMPLNMGAQQIERFVNIKVNLLLSNRRMKREMVKNLQPLRQNIYKILRKKKTRDFTQNKAKLKNRLKQEIVTLANSLLLSGTGTVEDVFFTKFVVK